MRSKPSRAGRRRHRTLAEYLARTPGATQTALARQVGTSQAQISRYVTGAAVPRVRLQKRLAEITGVPLDSFIRVYLARHASEGL